MDQAAAASETGTPESATAQQLERLIQKQIQVLEEQKKANETLEGVLRTLKCAERRQTLSSGDGLDASRWTSAWVRGQAAHWSKNHQDCTLEAIYNSGGAEDLQHSSLYHSSDARRSQYIACIYWRTFVERSGEVYDVHAEHDKNSHELLKLHPAFRYELSQAAWRKDVEMGPEVASNLPGGTYLKRIETALGEIPQGLVLLQDYLVPVARNLKPLETALPLEAGPRMDDLPDRVRDYLTWAENTGMCEVEGRHPRVAHTEAIVARCVCMSRVAWGKIALSEQASFDKMAQIDEEAETKKCNYEAQMLQSLLRRKFPKYYNILAEWETLDAKRAAEAAEEATGEGPSSSDGEHKRKFQKTSRRISAKIQADYEQKHTGGFN